MSVKKHRCTGCKKYFGANTMIVVTAGKFHSQECLIEYGLKKTNQVIKKAKTKFKQETTKMRKAHNESNRGYQLSKAQEEFNRYIRLRDRDQPCISCGTYEGKINAGHYLSRGGHPELRFNESNAHRQCEYCNTFLSGNAARYRINLLKKIGTIAVESLEGPQECVKLSLDDIKAIKLKYRGLRKELEL